MSSENLICFGRILYEDDGYIAFEVAKHSTAPMKAGGVDRIVPLIFVHREQDSGRSRWVQCIPWDHDCS